MESVLLPRVTHAMAWRKNQTKFKKNQCRSKRIITNTLNQWGSCCKQNQKSVFCIFIPAKKKKKKKHTPPHEQQFLLRKCSNRWVHKGEGRKQQLKCKDSTVFTQLLENVALGKLMQCTLTNWMVLQWHDGMAVCFRQGPSYRLVFSLHGQPQVVQLRITTVKAWFLKLFR